VDGGLGVDGDNGAKSLHRRREGAGRCHERCEEDPISWVWSGMGKGSALSLFFFFYFILHRVDALVTRDWGLFFSDCEDPDEATDKR
jgi:hypothetical protein